MDAATRASLEILEAQGGGVGQPDRLHRPLRDRRRRAAAAEDLSAPLADRMADRSPPRQRPHFHADPLLRADVRALLRQVPDIGARAGAGCRRARWPARSQARSAMA